MRRREVDLASVLVLIGTMLVDMIGFGIVLPLLPYYALRFGASNWMVGPLVASFSVAQLLAAPFLGKISDRYGRRPLILVGLAFSAVSYVLFGLATTVTVLFISRIVQGASGGTIAVAQAYVADTTAPERRAQVLGWLSAATGAAFMVGPVIGSWAWRWGGHAAPGLVAAALCLVNLGFALCRPASGSTSPRSGSCSSTLGWCRCWCAGSRWGRWFGASVSLSSRGWARRC